MVWERYDGASRELSWGELQDLSNRAAHLLRERGIERGDRVAVVLPPTPETAAVFFATWKLGAILLSMSVLYGDEGIRHRLEDSAPRVLVTDSANADRFDPALVETIAPARSGELSHGHPADPICEVTRRPTTRPSSTTPPARPAWRRGSSTPTATSSPTRSSPTATGSATATASTGWASGPGRRGSRRCSARGASAPSSTSTSARAASTRPASSTSSPATGSRTCSRPRPRCGR